MNRSPLSQVVVADTAACAGRTRRGAGARARSKVVAITGSNGKTSVKSRLLGILQHAGTAMPTPGNRNNEIGLPLAVIDAPDDADFAIYEMGAGKPGDIAYLTAIARPDVGVGEQRRARAPGTHGFAAGHRRHQRRDLRRAAGRRRGRDQCRRRLRAVLRRARAWPSPASALAWRQRPTSPRATSCSTARARAFTLVTPPGNIDIDAVVAGRHNVLNALAAAALALGAGASLRGRARWPGRARARSPVAL